MLDWLTEAFNADAELSLTVLVERQAVAFVMGCAIAGIYRLTRGPRAGGRARGGVDQPLTMMATLVLLTILIGMIGLVVGSNVARAFSLVGALSIVRFRTVVEDTRDTAFVIFAVAVGMAIGAGYLKVPLVGIPFVAAAALLFRPREVQPGGLQTGSGEPWRATVRLGAAFSDEPALLAIIDHHAFGAELDEVVTSRQGAAIDRTYRVRLRVPGGVTAFVEALNGIPGVQQVDLKRQE
ncbi:MAG: DUF4956 domain-containing protein [Phycisphaerales bacterium]|nr:DUF4956 domain-containing protein [Phycisphaerales bacterium]